MKDKGGTRVQCRVLGGGEGSSVGTLTGLLFSFFAEKEECGGEEGEGGGFGGGGVGDGKGLQGGEFFGGGGEGAAVDGLAEVVGEDDEVGEVGGAVVVEVAAGPVG